MLGVRVVWKQCQHAQTQPLEVRLPVVLTPQEKYRRILSNHLPDKVVDWVYDYLNLHKVHFHITRERQSKLGDYRWSQPRHPFHEISINGDLNPYYFFWVFLHEAAHLETHLKYNSVQPHGHEWQEEYRRLLAAHAAAFPPEVQPLIAKYIHRRPLSHPLQRQVEEALRRFDPGYNPDNAPLHLDDLQVGDRFRLERRPDRLFEALEKRRTRWLCREIPSGRQYLVDGAAHIVF